MNLFAEKVGGEAAYVKRVVVVGPDWYGISPIGYCYVFAPDLNNRSKIDQLLQTSRSFFLESGSCTKH